MSFSITGVSHKPRFSGVYIKPEFHHNEMTAVNFMVVPDSVFKGVRFNQKTNEDAPVSQRVSDLGRVYYRLAEDATADTKPELNNTTTDSVMLRNYNPPKMTALLRQVVAEAPMEDLDRKQVLHVMDQHTQDNEGPDYMVRPTDGEHWATMTFVDQEAFDAGFQVLKTVRPGNALDSLAPAKPLVRGADVNLSFPMPILKPPAGGQGSGGDTVNLPPGELKKDPPPANE